MKSVVVFCTLFVALALARPGEDHYTDRYDNVDLDQILNNDRLFNPYYECVMEKGKCTPDGKELKGHIKEALENECGKCTEAQKTGTERVIGHLINNKADLWNQLIDKYDPDRKYSTRYEAQLRKVKA